MIRFVIVDKSVLGAKRQKGYADVYQPKPVGWHLHKLRSTHTQWNNLKTLRGNSERKMLRTRKSMTANGVRFNKSGGAVRFQCARARSAVIAL